MRIRKKRESYEEISQTAALTLTACGGQNNNTGSDEAKTTSEDTLIVVSSGDPVNFHPDFKSDDNAWGPNQNIFNRLIKLNAYDQVIPDLAGRGAAGGL